MKKSWNLREILKKFHQNRRENRRISRALRWGKSGKHAKTKIKHNTSVFCNSVWILRKFWHFLKMFVKFRQNFIKISKKNTNFNAFFMKFELNKLFNLFKNDKIVTTFLLKFWDLSGAKVWKSCRSRKSWKNEYLVAIVAVDTAENGPPKVWPNWINYSVVSLARTESRQTSPCAFSAVSTPLRDMANCFSGFLEIRNQDLQSCAPLQSPNPKFRKILARPL